MIVSMWMTPDTICIAQDATIAEAAELMAKRRIRRLLVVKSQAENTQYFSRQIQLQP